MLCHLLRLRSDAHGSAITAMLLTMLVQVLCFDPAQRWDRQGRKMCRIRLSKTQKSDITLFLVGLLVF